MQTWFLGSRTSPCEIYLVLIQNYLQACDLDQELFMVLQDCYFDSPVYTYRFGRLDCCIFKTCNELIATLKNVSEVDYACNRILDSNMITLCGSSSWTLEGGSRARELPHSKTSYSLPMPDTMSVTTWGVKLI